MDRLSTAWLFLLALSAVSTLLSFDLVPAVAAGTVLLGLAWLKAQIILGDYLGLRRAPFWRRGFSFALTLYAAILLGLYLAA